MKQIQASALRQVYLLIDLSDFGVQCSLSFQSLGQISEALGKVLVSQEEDKIVKHGVINCREARMRNN